MAKEGVGGVRPSLAGGPPFFSSTPRAQKGRRSAAAMSLSRAREVGNEVVVAEKGRGRGKGLTSRQGKFAIVG